MYSRIAKSPRALLLAIAVAILALSLTALPNQAWAGQTASLLAGGLQTQGEDPIDDSGIIHGVESDGATYVGNTLSVSLSGIDSIRSGFAADYNAGKARVIWTLTNSDGDNLSEITPIYSGGTFSILVKSEYAGQYLICYYYSDRYGGSLANTSGKKVPVKNVTITDWAKIDSVTYSRGFTSKDIVIEASGFGRYSKLGSYTSLYDKRIVLYVNDAKIGERTVASNYYAKVAFSGVSVNPFGPTNARVEVYTGFIGPTWQEVIIPAETLGNTQVLATKISGKQAQLRWSDVYGASGYYVYQGKKKIKTLPSTANTYTVKRKGAGKGKFRVVPYASVAGKVITSNSNVAKPQKNVVKFSVTTNPKLYSYMTCPFRISKIQLTGKTYTITGYALNNRMWKMQKYKQFRIQLFVDGKCVLNKKVNKKINAKPYQAKKVKLKLKGKAGADLRNGILSRSVSYVPKWVFSNGKEVK